MLARQPQNTAGKLLATKEQQVFVVERHNCRIIRPKNFFAATNVQQPTPLLHFNLASPYLASALRPRRFRFVRVLSRGPIATLSGSLLRFAADGDSSHWFSVPLD